MSSFNFTNVEINSGRKQIIDILHDKKVIDDRIEGIERLVAEKKAAIVKSLEIGLFHVDIKWTVFDKKLTSSIRNGFMHPTMDSLAIASRDLLCFHELHPIFNMFNGINFEGFRVFVSSYFKPFFSISMYYLMQNKDCINTTYCTLATI